MGSDHEVALKNRIYIPPVEEYIHLRSGAYRFNVSIQRAPLRFLSLNYSTLSLAAFHCTLAWPQVLTRDKLIIYFLPILKMKCLLEF
jgi:hypothetical protein